MRQEQFLEMASNLARYHREHEKFYARAPLEEAASLQRTSAALRALAERWSTADPRKPEAASPFSGAEDLNDERAIDCDLIDHASDLAAQSATLVHDNERRWRVFVQRVEELTEHHG